MRKLFAIFGLAAALWSTDAGCADFSLEWMLVRGDVRDRLAATLRAEDRLDELAFLEAAWDGNADGAEAAARVLVDKTHDPAMTRWLARYLRRTGRADEAARIAPRPQKLRSVALRAAAPDVTSHRPVVFLHGYNGSAGTWADFVRVFRSAGYGADDLLVFDYGEMFGADEDTPIEDIARRVVPRVRSWLRQRAGLSEDDDSHDGDLPAPDWICHSMGGLVFRVVLKNAPGLVHRCVTLGTPHFGQAIGEISGVTLLTGYQTEQMSHGSTFLWELAADWQYRGHRTDDILFIVGAATTDKYLDFEDELAQDGLVDTFSATMLTQADGAAFARRTFFVNRIHSTSLDIIFGGKYAGLVSLPRGEDDPVFKLAHGYLNDAGYFADGAVPSQTQVLMDEGLSPGQREEIFRRVREHGALFVQVMDSTPNTPAYEQRPIEYDPGNFFWDPIPDNVVEGIFGQGREWTGEGDGLLRANGSGDEGCVNGLVLLYGNIPTGLVAVAVGEPSDYAGPFEFPYFETTVINAGGTTLWRTRPGAAKPLSKVEVADIDGTSRPVVIPNEWLSEKGFARHAENLRGCVDAASGEGANGWPVAASYLLGLDPSDAGSTLRIGSFAVGDGLSFSVLAGEHPLVPGEAPVILQAKRSLGDAWADAATPVGSWSLPLADARFFRAVFKWHD